MRCFWLKENIPQLRPFKKMNQESTQAALGFGTQFLGLERKGVSGWL